MKTTVKKLLTLTLLATLGTNLIQAMPPKKKTQAKASNKKKTKSPKKKTHTVENLDQTPDSAMPVTNTIKDHEGTASQQDFLSIFEDHKTVTLVGPDEQSYTISRTKLCEHSSLAHDMFENSDATHKQVDDKITVKTNLHPFILIMLEGTFSEEKTKKMLVTETTDLRLIIDQIMFLGLDKLFFTYQKENETPRSLAYHYFMGLIEQGFFKLPKKERYQIFSTLRAFVFHGACTYTDKIKIKLKPQKSSAAGVKNLKGGIITDDRDLVEYLTPKDLKTLIFFQEAASDSFDLDLRKETELLFLKIIISLYDISHETKEKILNEIQKKSSIQEILNPPRLKSRGIRELETKVYLDLLISNIVQDNLF